METKINTTEEAEAAWIEVDNYRNPQSIRVPAALQLLNWMDETGGCPHPTGRRVVTELKVLWVCAHVLAIEVESFTDGN